MKMIQEVPAIAGTFILENNEKSTFDLSKVPILLGWEMGFEPTVFGTTSLSVQIFYGLDHFILFLFFFDFSEVFI